MRTAIYHCLLCNKRLHHIVIDKVDAEGKSYAILECKNCNVAITTPLPSINELSALYSPPNYRSESGKRFNRFAEFVIYIMRTRRMKRIEKYIGRGRILDVGCGRGLFLHLLKSHGWKVMGIEVNEETAAAARKNYNIPVITTKVMSSSLADGSFDVITLNHVLEHLHDPKEMVKECRRLLRKGGLLVTAVPNLSSLQASFGKESWFHLDPPYHIHHFTQNGLIRLLETHQFKVCTVRHFDLEYNPFGWLQTLLNKSGICRNLFYNLMKSTPTTKNSFRKNTIRDFILTFAFLPFYAPLALILSILESFLVRKGGTIEVFSLKN